MKDQLATPQIVITAGNPDVEEVAAAIAGIERFLGDTAQERTQPSVHQSPWLRAGLLEGVTGISLSEDFPS